MNIYNGASHWTEEDGGSSLEATITLVEYSPITSPEKRSRPACMAPDSLENGKPQMDLLGRPKTEFERKEWTIYLIDTDCKKTLASYTIDMAAYADERTVPHQLKLVMKPVHRKVVHARVGKIV